MTKFRIEDEVFSAIEDAPQSILEAAHQQRLRPFCLCRPGGVPLYIAKLPGGYILKRMPGSAVDHHPQCDHFEPPAELSGLGEVQGSAIQEDPDSGKVKLKFDFSLSKRTTAGSPPAKSGEPVDTIESDPKKLTLSSTLDYLLEEAGLNRWTPAMAGKRNWYVVRAAVTRAVGLMTARAGELSDLLYIPETFSVDKKIEIQARRLTALSRICSPESLGKKMMLALVEVKGFEPGRYGQRMIAKHLPDFPLLVPDDLYRKLQKNFAPTLGLWDANPNSHLVCLATFAMGANGLATIAGLTLRLLNQNWLTVRDGFDWLLLDHLESSKRKFTQGLRYNLRASQPTAVATLSDSTTPHAIYVIPPGASEDYRTTLATLQAESSISSLTWDVAVGGLPELPQSATA
jgi:hypothetical protein